MLSLADAAICARDPALPGLSIVLDADALGARSGIPGLSSVYVRYKPGTSCVVGLVDTDSSFAAYSAMTYPLERFCEVRDRKHWQSGPDQVVYLNDICTALVPFAHDRRIKTAKRLKDPDRRADCFAKLGLPNIGLTLLRYKCGRRIVARVAGSDDPLASLKSYAAQGFNNSVVGAQFASAMGHAPIMSINTRLRSIATRWVDGTSLCSELAGTPSTSSLLLRGMTLANIHQNSFYPGNCIDGNREARDLLATAEAASQLLPEHRHQLHKMSREIAAQGRRLSFQSTLLHGDFSSDQVIVKDERPIIVDWDRISRGDPARDLGTFLARFEVQAIDGYLTSNEAAASSDAFVEGYIRRSGKKPDCLAYHQARALFALMTDDFRARRTDWPEQMTAIMMRIDSVMNNAAKSLHQAHKSMTPGLSVALDPTTMGARIGDFLDARIQENAAPAISLLRHKPGRRALIRYDISLADNLPPVVILGKLRAKGADRRTPALHCSLRAAGLDGSAPNYVGVAPVLGLTNEPALWFQPLLQGATMTEHLTALGLAASQSAGHALACLHSTGVKTDRLWSMVDEIAVLDRALSEVENALPTRSAEINETFECARRKVEDLGQITTTCIHRDFYPDQLLLDTPITWLLDLDDMAQGDPTIDVANYFSHLTEFGLRWHADQDTFVGDAQAFMASYQTHRYLDRERAEILHWVSLARGIGIAHRIEGRRHTVDPLISLCHSALSGQGRTMFIPAHD